jgi:chitinase
MMLRYLLLLIAAFTTLSAHATGYQFTGMPYNSVTGLPLTTSLRTTGYFTTAVALPANLASVDITAQITSYDFSDGAFSVDSSDPSARIALALVSTDAGGHITSSILIVQRWLNGPGPHVAGTHTLNAMAISTAASFNIFNANCTAVATAANGVSDVCTSTAFDPARSLMGQFPAGGTWQSVPFVSINSVTQAEGNAGSSPMVFTVSLSAAPTSAVSVNWRTVDGGATSPQDYDGGFGTLSWAPGDPLTKTISIPVKGDTLVEPDETFTVDLYNPSGALLDVASTGTGTITNDDAAAPSTPGSPVPVPGLSAWGLLLMSTLLSLGAVLRRPRRG